jgi:tripartite-type tricarboxylate transporter receptor subunit TctC
VVRIVNPFPPGGSVDVLARVLAQKLSENLGQQFIMEMKHGPLPVGISWAIVREQQTK